MERYRTEHESAGKRSTSVRLEHVEILEQIVRNFGFKDRSHFFQLCTDAALRAPSSGPFVVGSNNRDEGIYIRCAEL
jgi:hypothetical protein